MATFYVDSSVLVKQHVDEIGSAWTRMTLDADAGHHIAVARIAEVEIVAAFARRLREGTLDQDALARLEEDFRILGARAYTWIELTPAVVTGAQSLVRRHPLRALDAIHLAAAQLVSAQLVAAGLAAPVFMAADERLLAAARAEGMAVDTPHDHP
jgi:predicted nucleic acid-binding protein